MVIDKANRRPLIAETSRQKESSFCTLLPTRGGWLKPDKVQMELLGPVMRFPECMFGLGDYRPRLPPHSHSHMHADTPANSHVRAGAHTPSAKGYREGKSSWKWWNTTLPSCLCTFIGRCSRTKGKWVMKIDTAGRAQTMGQLVSFWK